MTAVLSKQAVQTGRTADGRMLAPLQFPGTPMFHGTRMTHTEPCCAECTEKSKNVPHEVPQTFAGTPEVDPDVGIT